MTGIIVGLVLGLIVWAVIGAMWAADGDRNITTGAAIGVTVGIMFYMAAASFVLIVRGLLNMFR
jgi:Mg/Co/Ni transporter MgtE